MTLLPLLSHWSADFEYVIIFGKAKELELNQFYIKGNCFDTKNPKVRIEILVTGTKIEACHLKVADFDDLVVSPKLVLN